MNKKISISNGIRVLIALSIIIALANCQKEMDRYYNEGPSDVGPPIVTYLEQDADFSKFSALIKKVGMYSLLQKGAVYTMLAPTNNAIDQYNQSNPDKTTELMDSVELTAFINHHVLFGIHYQYDFNKQYLRNNNIKFPTRWYDSKFHQYKSIAVYPPNFFGGLGEIDYTNDYETIYQTTSAKAENTFNVENALVLSNKMDIDCSNGVVHGIDKVIEPQLNIEKFLTTNPNYSIYSGFIDRFDTLVYDPDNSRIVDGVEEKAYTKEYWYTATNGNRVKFDFSYGNESNDLSLFAAEDKVINDFFGPYLPNFENDYNKIPSYIIVELLKHNVARLGDYKSRLFPAGMLGGIRMSNSKTVLNINDYIDDKALPLSNGFIYPVKKILNPPLLSRITGRFLLDPQFESMRYLLEETNRMNTLAYSEYSSDEYMFGERVRLPKSWTIIAPASQVFVDSITPGIEQWYPSQLSRLSDYLIIPDTVYVTNPGDAVFDKGVHTKPFNSGYYKTYSRTYMRKVGNTLYSSLYPDSTANIIDEIYGSNGVIYVVDDMLFNVASNYSVFSVLVNNGGTISKVFMELTNGSHSELINELRYYSRDYTLFMPTDDAINAYDKIAANNDEFKAWDEMTTEDRDYFIRNHIVRKRFIVEAYKNMVQYTSVGEKIELFTKNGQLRIKGEAAIPDAGFSSINIQAANGVVNLIDHVLLPDFSKNN